MLDLDSTTIKKASHTERTTLPARAPPASDMNLVTLLGAWLHPTGCLLWAEGRGGGARMHSTPIMPIEKVQVGARVDEKGPSRPRERFFKMHSSQTRVANRIVTHGESPECSKI